MDIKVQNQPVDEFLRYIEDWVWEVDENDRYTYSSPQVETILGYSPDEILGLTPFDLMTREEAKRVRADYLSCKKNRRSFSLLKNYNLHKDGSLVLLETSGRPLFSGEGKLLGYRGVDRDITARESQVIEKRVYEEMLESLSEASFSLDADGNFVYVNSKFTEMYGYTREEILGQNVALLNPPNVGEQNSTARSLTLLAEEGDISLVRKRKKKNGELLEVYIRARVVKDDDGGVIRVVASYMDLSDLNKLKSNLSQTTAELYETVQELEDTQAELMAAQRIAKVGSWTMDVASGEVFWTEELHRMMGTNPKGSPPNYSNHAELFTPESWTKLDNALGLTVATGKPYELELQLNSTDELEHWIMALGEPRKTRDGRITGLRGVAMDISDRKRAEHHVRQNVLKLRQAVNGTVELAMRIGELRDPYTAGHEDRVAHLAVAIGEGLGLDEKAQQTLMYVGQLHDIGKIRIPSEILAKPGKLTETEYELIKEHSQAGWQILEAADLPWPAALVAQQHHERLDGSGYPLGLKGDEICIEARIVAVADVVEAMVSHRPYRPGLGVLKAMDEIRQGRDTRYDSEVVDACLNLFDKGYSLPSTPSH